VSQITPWKGQDVAIRAVAELRRGGIDAHLLIVGRVTFSGPGVRHDNEGYLRSLHSLVEELGAPDAVHFLGGRSDVPGILRALDLSLLPSRNEPFGRVTVESMAMGTPPLVSEVGSGPELVQDGVSGRLLPPGRPELWAAAARALLADRPALARMGARAREAARRFSDDSQIQGVLAVYERLLGLPEGEPRASSVPVEQGARESAEAVSWPG
jgi:glycosyltransferase involved in cell wall biosynthesis